MRKLILCLLSFFFLTTIAQISKKNNFLQTKTATSFLQIQQERKTGANRMARSVQTSKTIHVSTAGTLDSLLTSTEKNTITDLTVSGILDARDFRILRDSLLNLTALDISAATVVSYSGSGGTGYYSTSYPANEIPEYAFYTSGGQPGTVNSGPASIILPSSVTSIGSMAFTFCSSLISISISSTVTQIGLMAFVGCNATFIVDQVNPNYSSVNGVLLIKKKRPSSNAPFQLPEVTQFLQRLIQ